MTVVLDTGPLVSWLDPDDPRHERAVAMLDPLLGGSRGMLVSTDYVYDEGMTLIRMRKASEELAESSHRLFWGPWDGIPRALRVMSTSLDDLQQAGRFQVEHFDQGLPSPMPR